jgi:hypothetical protein
MPTVSSEDGWAGYKEAERQRALSFLGYIGESGKVEGLSC